MGWRPVCVNEKNIGVIIAFVAKKSIIPEIETVRMATGTETKNLRFVPRVPECRRPTLDPTLERITSLLKTPGTILLVDRMVTPRWATIENALAQRGVAVETGKVGEQAEGSEPFTIAVRTVRSATDCDPVEEKPKNQGFRWY